MPTRGHELLTRTHNYHVNNMARSGAHVQSGHGCRDRGFPWAQLYGLPLTKSDLAIRTIECPIPTCQEQRPTPTTPHLLQMYHFLLAGGGSNQPSAGRVITMGPFHHGGCCSVDLSSMPTTPQQIPRLWAYAQSRYPIQHCFCQQNSFYSKIRQERAQENSHWSYLIPAMSYFSSSGMVDCLLNIHLQVVPSCSLDFSLC